MNDPALDFSAFMAQQPPGQGARPNLRFFIEAKPHPGKSAEEGRPVYVDVDMVSIINPGSKDEVVRIAKDKIKDDPFIAWAYDQWLKTKQQPTEGTPIDRVPFLKPSQIKELQAVNIMSLENLAGLSDVQAQRAGFEGMKLRDTARAYLAAAKDTALVVKMQAELATRDLEIEALKKQMAEINTRFETMMNKVAA